LRNQRTLTGPPNPNCNWCYGFGWYYLRGAKRFPMTETCRCKIDSSNKQA